MQSNQNPTGKKVSVTRLIDRIEGIADATFSVQDAVEWINREMPVMEANETNLRINMSRKLVGFYKVGNRCYFTEDQLREYVTNFVRRVDPVRKAK